MTFDSQPVHVQLGAHTYEVKPQSIGFLRHQLGSLFTDLTSGGDVGNIADFMVEKGYNLLSVFIPPAPDGTPVFMPRYEFEGYATEEAWQNGEYDPRYDKGPSVPQVRTALDVAARANGLDLWKAVTQLVDPTLLRATIGKVIADAVSTTPPSSIDSPPSMDGASSPTGEMPEPTTPESPTEG